LLCLGTEEGVVTVYSESGRVEVSALAAAHNDDFVYFFAGQLTEGAPIRAALRLPSRLRIFLRLCLSIVCLLPLHHLPSLPLYACAAMRQDI